LALIPVAPQPEPADFDKNVRKPGLKWIAKSGLDLLKPIPGGTKIPSYWTKNLPELRRVYGGICAYVCVYIELVTGSPSVEHFVPKSKALNQAYEWDNYRLACTKINSRKRDFLDVLDPFTLAVGWFELNLLDGSIFPNTALTALQRKKVQQTIDRLKLDDAECRELRLAYFNDFLAKEISGAYFKKRSPFVWLEAQRQGML
jgi:uncharacterized protein (TIGR02646 family)